MTELSDQVKIESINLRAEIPVKTSADFTLDFCIVSPSLKQQSKKLLGEQFKKAIPRIRFSTYGDDQTHVSFSISEIDHPGFCRHLVNLFQQQNIDVKLWAQLIKSIRFLKK